VRPEDVERLLAAVPLPATSAELERRVRDAAVRRSIAGKRRIGIAIAVAAALLFGVLTWGILAPGPTPTPVSAPVPAAIAKTQLESYDQVLETARKESKPVLCLIHRNDWAGGEAAAKGMKELVGDLAPRLLVAHADAQSDGQLPGLWKVTRLDGNLVFLDPVARETKDQVFARYEKKIQSPEDVRAFLVDGLKTWAEVQASRRAFDTLWAAWTKGDYAAFKAALWPAQVKHLGDEKLQPAFDRGKDTLQNRLRFYHRAVLPEETKPRQRELDPALEAVFRVTFVMVDKDGREDSSSMRAIRTGGKYYIEYAN
jgi:hypothetical protein